MHRACLPNYFQRGEGKSTVTKTRGNQGKDVNLLFFCTLLEVWHIIIHTDDLWLASSTSQTSREKGRTFMVAHWIYINDREWAQWLSWWSVLLGIEGLIVWEASQAESLCCVLKQDTLYTACYRFNLGRQKFVPTLLKKCWLSIQTKYMRRNLQPPVSHNVPFQNSVYMQSFECKPFLAYLTSLDFHYSLIYRINILHAGC